MEAFHEGKARDIADEQKENGKPCIVIGSGPSLDEQIGFLKDWKGGIICTTSHARTLIHFGVEPTHILALDPFCTWEEIEGVDWSKTRTKLVCHPGVYSTLIEHWPNEFVLYRQNGGDPNSFYGSTQKRMYTISRDSGKGIRNPLLNYMIRTEITLFASSPPMQMFVAQVLGYGTIFLCGVDFGFHSGKSRFTEYVPSEGKWEKKESPIGNNATIVGDNGVLTQDIHLYYKKNFFSAWRLSKQTVYSCDKGLLYEVPYKDIQEVVKNQGEGFLVQDEAFIAEIAEKYLIRVGAFAVYSSKGLSFLEFKEKNDIIGYIDNLKKRYTCPVCKAPLMANDDKDHTGENCPNCEANKKFMVEPQQGKIERAIQVDKQKNADRFDRLMMYAEKMKYKEPEDGREAGGSGTGEVLPSEVQGNGTGIGNREGLSGTSSVDDSRDVGG